MDFLASECISVLLHIICGLFQVTKVGFGSKVP